MKYIFLALGVLKLLFVDAVYSQSDDQECLLKELKQSSSDTTVDTLRKRCDNLKTDMKLGAISNRIAEERKTEFNPYVITPHRINYILPFAKTNSINRSAYSGLENFATRLEDEEVKFQVSFKTPLSQENVFVDGDGFYFALTIKSFWQLYADHISAPFRETNYRPELFYLMPLNWHPVGGNTGLVIGVEHESNGRSLPLSRSWNRVFVNFLYEKNSFALSLRPWYRIKEDPKEDAFDSGGDDNPDIEDYMGRFELLGAYKWSKYTVHVMGRKNFDTEHGATELGVTFPISGRVKGYVQYFNGYGESLIDYNHKQSRIGLGIVIADLL